MPDHFVPARGWAIPMQPSPRADTSRLLFPSFRFCIFSSIEIVQERHRQAPLSRGMILIVAERARAPIMGLRYGLLRYFARSVKRCRLAADLGLEPRRS